MSATLAPRDEKPIRPQERWKRRNPKAVWAHDALRSGLRRGLLQPEPCKFCGAPKSEAHHPDYDRPLAVQWLCRACHKAEHGRLKREGGR